MERKVGFYSDGLKIAGVLFEPEHAAARSCPAIVLCQGMIGIKEYFWFPELGRQFAAAGFVALIWDYRGVGDSEGEPGRLYPQEQAEDIRNGLTYLETHPKVDPQRLALIGWSFGGGMVPYVAGVDDRVKCAISVAGWSDGKRWAQGVRRDYEWQALLDRIAEDRKTRVLTGKSQLRSLMDILVPDPAEQAERDRILTKVPFMESPSLTPYSLASEEMLHRFRPIDVVDRISPRAILYIVAGRDTICPAEQAIEMYHRSGEPRKLWVIPGLSHYGVYGEPHKTQVMDMSLAWLKEHLEPARASRTRRG
jgi:dipeptidyl aminopeptidase/acylaminoacyl peptidase